MSIFTDEELDDLLTKRSLFYSQADIRTAKKLRDAVEEKILNQLENRFKNEDSLERVIREIIEWQKVQFPQATQRSRATHLLREAAELYVAPHDDLEAVDIIFLAVGIIEEAGFDLLELLRYKLKINKERQWGKIDSDGVVEHVEEIVQPSIAVRGNMDKEAFDRGVRKYIDKISALGGDLSI